MTELKKLDYFKSDIEKILPDRAEKYDAEELIESRLFHNFNMLDKYEQTMLLEHEIANRESFHQSDRISEVQDEIDE